MITSTNILNAAGLENKDELEALLNVYGSMQGRNKKLLDYYESDVRIKNIGIDNIPDTVNVDECTSWPKKAVTSVSERSRFDGYVFASGEKNPALEKVVRDNRLIGSYNRHAPLTLLHGCMFATVQRSKKTAIRFHSVDTAAAIWDSAEGRIGSGFVIADQRRTSYSPNKPVPVQVNLHLPGKVEVIKRTDQARWVSEPLPTPLDRPMMEPFAFRPTGVKPFGESRISKAVMSIADDVIRTLTYMAVSSAFYAAPLRYLLGLSDENYDEMVKDKWSSMMGGALLATRDEDGGIPTAGQFAPASPEPYIALLRAYATLFSSATGVPVDALGIVQDNPSSAQAISAARENICIAAEDLNEASAESLREIALMAMAIEENKPVDALTEEQQSVMAHFKDPNMPSIVSQADAAVKIAAADTGFGGTDTFYEMLGFDQATITRIKSDKRKNQARRMLEEAMAENNANTTFSTRPVNE